MTQLTVQSQSKWLIMGSTCTFILQVKAYTCMSLPFPLGRSCRCVCWGRNKITSHVCASTDMTRLARIGTDSVATTVGSHTGVFTRLKAQLLGFTVWCTDWTWLPPKLVIVCSMRNSKHTPTISPFWQERSSYMYVRVRRNYCKRKEGLSY